MTTRRHTGADPHEVQLAWTGRIGTPGTATLRDTLFDALEVPGSIGVRLDVRGVTSINRGGLAILVGANHRAAAVGRKLTIVDGNGPVTRALAALRLLGSFHVVLVLPPVAETGSITAPSSPQKSSSSTEDADA